MQGLSDVFLLFLHLPLIETVKHDNGHDLWFYVSFFVLLVLRISHSIVCNCSARAAHTVLLIFSYQCVHAHTQLIPNDVVALAL